MRPPVSGSPAVAIASAPSPVPTPAPPTSAWPTVLSRADLAARIAALPKAQRDEGLRLLKLHLATSPAAAASTSSVVRDPRTRARYARDPAAYLSDVLGRTVTPQLDAVLSAVLTRTRILVAGANAVGKTDIMAALVAWYMDAVAAQPVPGTDPDAPPHLYAEQGARVLLPGPDHDTVFATIYQRVLVHIATAVKRGYPMPGTWSEASVLWRVAPEWEIEAFSPPKSSGGDINHSASGRHHPYNQIALIEEGQGVRESVWVPVEGMCASDGNVIVSSFNPTRPWGPTWDRARRGSYLVLHLDAFDHPNVRERREVVRGAISHRVTDARVAECRERGKYGAPAEGGVLPDPNFNDFVYALPPALAGAAPGSAPDAPVVSAFAPPTAETPGPRADGLLGSPDGIPRVYRPTETFQALVRGQWPQSSDGGLFEPGSIDASMGRWLATDDPTTPPDAVGIDPAREGDDDTCAAPRWGESGATVLRAWAEAITPGGDPAIREALLTSRRIRVGRIRTAPKGDGPATATWLHTAFPASPWTVDEGGGYSVLDHARVALQVQAAGVVFAGRAPVPPAPGAPYCENIRAALYVYGAMLVKLGLVDLPDDQELRKELLAHKLKFGSRTVEVEEGGVKTRRVVETVLVQPKSEVKKLLGRSPDRADAVLLALWETVPPDAGKWPTFATW